MQQKSIAKDEKRYCRMPGACAQSPSPATGGPDRQKIAIRQVDRRFNRRTQEAAPGVEISQHQGQIDDESGTCPRHVRHKPPRRHVARAAMPGLRARRKTNNKTIRTPPGRLHFSRKNKKEPPILQTALRVTAGDAPTSARRQPGRPAYAVFACNSSRCSAAPPTCTSPLSWPPSSMTSLP